MRQLHPIQLRILKKLLFADGLRYTQIKPDPEMENNQFDFHLDQLIKERLVVKQNGIYQLTSVGKEYANRMDTDQVVISKQAKISAWICVMREKSGETAFLRLSGIYIRKA